MIDAYASEPHYRDHIAPVFDALPPELKGEWSCAGRGPVIVASYKDYWTVRGRPVVFMEHGAGQTYHKHASYAGSRYREGVKLFLCPSQRVADLNQVAHPQIPAAIVGCPKLDAYTGKLPKGGVVAIAFHWNGTICAETRTAMPYYLSVLPAISAEFTMVGHAHPRMIRAAAVEYQKAGIPVAYSDAEVFAAADVLVVDNSSIGWEFIALDRPVIWLNAPWYRREVEHGLRFWEHAGSGVQVDEPADLPDAIRDVLRHDDRGAKRAAAAESVYAYRDGTSAARAADAIVEVMG